MSLVRNIPVLKGKVEKINQSHNQVGKCCVAELLAKIKAFDESVVK